MSRRRRSCCAGCCFGVTCKFTFQGLLMSCLDEGDHASSHLFSFCLLFFFFFHSFHGKSQVVKKIITVEQRLEQMLRDSYLSCLKLWTSDLVPLSSSFSHGRWQSKYRMLKLCESMNVVWELERTISLLLNSLLQNFLLSSSPFVSLSSMGHSVRHLSRHCAPPTSPQPILKFTCRKNARGSLCLCCRHSLVLGMCSTHTWATLAVLGS